MQFDTRFCGRSFTLSLECGECRAGLLRGNPWGADRWSNDTASELFKPMPDETSSYISLQREIHEALRLQHPEWVEPDGSSPICDSYEERLAELLHLFAMEEERSAA